MTTARSSTQVAVGRAGEGALQRFMSTYWLKKRLVLAQREAGSTGQPSGPAADMAVEIYTGPTPEDRVPAQVAAALEETIGPDLLRSRLERPDVTLVLGVDRRTGRPTGFRWALHPSDEVVWHDNIPVEPGEAFGFNAYTYPSFRRMGLYSELVRRGNAYLLGELGREKVTIVVEASNQASLRANLEAGYSLVGTNHLVKVMRRNVYSVFRDGTTGATRAYYVFRNQRGRRL